jgi:tetratricopeptide (TPR) repeat protein
MRRARLPAALFLATLLSGGGAGADVVQTVDGQWKGLPAGVTLGEKEDPPGEVLRGSTNFKVEATFESVKARGLTSSAGLVKDLWASDQDTVGTLKEGLAQYRGSFYDEAEALFAQAAAEEDISPLGKQQALYLRVLALADWGKAQEALAAIDDLLAAFPNTYYFADVQILRAKIALGNDAEVAKALDSIKGARGMNRRDFFRAEYWRIFLTLETPRKYDQARAAYEAMVKETERLDALEVGPIRERARVGIANCLLRGNPPQPDPAKAAFERALAASTDPDVLAAAHAGLGDVAFGTAKRLQDERKMEEAKGALVDSTEHYLRVTLVYRDQVTDMTPVLTSFENQAKAFAALFDQSDGKDCLSAARAYAAYYDLHGLLEGAQKRRIALEAGAFNAKRKEKGCK